MKRILLGAALVAFAAGASAQDRRPDYGPAVNAGTAKKIAAGVIAECQKNGWNVAVAVVDTHGELVAFERMDGSNTGGVDIARQKAWTAARFRRDSKAFADGLAAGRLGSLSFDGVVSVEGGVLVVADGRIVGAIGVSGATSAQDAQCARAGAAAAISR